MKKEVKEILLEICKRRPNNVYEYLSINRKLTLEKLGFSLACPACYFVAGCYSCDVPKLLPGAEDECQWKRDDFILHATEEMWDDMAGKIASIRESK